jgi:hypothetical protein
MRPLPLEKIAMRGQYLPIPETLKIVGFGRSKLYEEIALGKIKAVKCGSRTLCVGDSVADYMENLPPAVIRAPRQAA